MKITLTFTTHRAADIAFADYIYQADHDFMGDKLNITRISRYNRTVTVVYGG